MRARPNANDLRARLAAVLEPWLSGLRSAVGPKHVRFDDESGAYESTQVFRGFPVGGMGTGGFGVGSAGGFCDWRGNNNWLRPVSVMKGSFLALSTTRPSVSGRDTRLLRLGVPGGRAPEYQGARLPGRTRFVGELPAFTLEYPDLYPLQLTLSGVTPLVPHDVERSSLPLVLLTTTLRSRVDEPSEAALAFSFENVLGRGGSGQTGIVRGRGPLPRLPGRVRYDDVSQNRQHLVADGALRGLSFVSDLEPPAGSHQRGTLGELRLLVDGSAPDLELSYARAWDAAADSCRVLDELARDGRLSSDDDDAERPAGAVCAHLTVPARETRTLQWLLAWWAPEHITERDLVRAHRKNRRRPRAGQHAGEHVGHRYAETFSSLSELVTSAHAERSTLEERSRETLALLRETTLPAWLQRALTAATDTALMNTVLPRDGRLYTLEAVDWGWPFGGLVGTIDQRLSASPYLQTFFPALDETELDTFARHTQGGEVPHGIGNCDLALDSSDVPYGRPLDLGPLYRQGPWPDLTLSWLLQAYRSTTLTGDDGLFERHWPKVKEMVAFLERCTRHGVPEGGSTYDTFRFPGTFSYTATLALCAYRALSRVARQREPDYARHLDELGQRVRARIDDALWDARGFFRTSPGRKTLFFGSLAGEWVARRIGLGSLLGEARVRSHLAHAQRVLVDKRRQGLAARLDPAPFVQSEARYSGRARRTHFAGLEVFAYAGQVVSYHALLAIHAGLVEEGLATLQVLSERAAHAGHPWSTDLYGNAGAVYMTHAAWWALPDALSGACLRVREGVLQLRPRPLPGGGEVQRLPVFQPRFWGVLEIDRRKRELVLHVRKVFGGPVVLQAIELVLDDGTLARTPCQQALEPGGQLRLSLPSGPV